MYKYLKEHIIEELEGAEDYWKKAVHYRDSEIGHIFREMANTELQHANALFKIFNNLNEQKSMSTLLEYYEEIVAAYDTIMHNIEELKKIY